MNEKKSLRKYARKVASRHSQKGELSMIEAGAVMAGAAILAIAVIAGGKYVLDMIHSSQFKSEAQMFHSGILNATQNDSDFSAETLQILAQNRAFDSAGSRLATDKSSVKGLFNSTLSISVGTLVTASDSIILTYPVPASVCSMSVAALATVYTQVSVNGTIVSAPGTAFTSSAAATTCASAGATATLALYTSRT
ncbi:hypothetical protein [Caballeronia mineralivorans]|jgi:hypothetical protein|uniref:hypothetical protein n=1 Tax=Caballeronia mineralivorans TaxID=2010198 RepID=UPI002AFECFF9|nr:hypothetical protein [Caballeronia mineralivorans]MEA3099450.1 hypothetical protein [Caballeronia mineralivorans]